MAYQVACLGVWAGAARAEVPRVAPPEIHLGFNSPYDAGLNTSTTVAVMLETYKAVQQADAFATVPGLHIPHVGLLDLADDLAVPGKLGDPRRQACHERGIAAYRLHGMVAGIGGVGGRRDIALRAIRQGVPLLAAAIDWGIMPVAARQRVEALRDHKEA